MHCSLSLQLSAAAVAAVVALVEGGERAAVGLLLWRRVRLRSVRLLRVSRLEQQAQQGTRQLSLLR